MELLIVGLEFVWLEVGCTCTRIGELRDGRAQISLPRIQGSRRKAEALAENRGYLPLFSNISP
jgi:hypothetical protein